MGGALMVINPHGLPYGGERVEHRFGLGSYSVQAISPKSGSRFDWEVRATVEGKTSIEEVSGNRQLADNVGRAMVERLESLLSPKAKDDAYWRLYKRNPGAAWHKSMEKIYEHKLSEDLKAGHAAGAEFWQGAESAEARAVAASEKLRNPRNVVEVIEASRYYGRHASGWVVLVNGSVVLHGDKTDAERIAARARAANPRHNLKYVLRRDGKVVFVGDSEAEVLRYIHRKHSFSLKHALEHEGYAVRLERQPGTENPRRAVWFYHARIGDASDYESFGSLEELTDRLVALQVGHVTGWVNRGMGFVTPQFEGHNYISVFRGHGAAEGDTEKIPAPDRAYIERRLKEENPRRPTKKFMRRCMKGDGKGYDPGAVCASQWRKMSRDARGRWVREENPRKDKAEKAYKAFHFDRPDRAFKVRAPKSFPRKLWALGTLHKVICNKGKVMLSGGILAAGGFGRVPLFILDAKSNGAPGKFVAGQTEYVPQKASRLHGAVYYHEHSRKHPVVVTRVAPGYYKVAGGDLRVTRRGIVG